MLHRRKFKFTPREDYRRQEARRTHESSSLSETFRELNSLTLEFGYFNPDGVARNRQSEYTVNLERASSVFRPDFANAECIGDEFYLSVALASVVAARQVNATGEMCCQGWLNQTSIDRMRSHGVLRYKLTIAYGKRASKKTDQLQHV